MREVQLQSMTRAIQPVLIHEAGGLDKLLHDTRRKTEILKRSEKLAEDALRVGLTLSDINVLAQKTSATIEALIQEKKISNASV